MNAKRLAIPLLIIIVLSAVAAGLVFFGGQDADGPSGAGSREAKGEARAGERGATGEGRSDGATDRAPAPRGPDARAGTAAGAPPAEESDLLRQALADFLGGRPPARFAPEEDAPAYAPAGDPARPLRCAGRLVLPEERAGDTPGVVVVGGRDETLTAAVGEDGAFAVDLPHRRVQWRLLITSPWYQPVEWYLPMDHGGERIALPPLPLVATVPLPGRKGQATSPVYGVHGFVCDGRSGAPLAGVEVRRFTGGGATPTATAVTDALGHYGFVDRLPGDAETVVRIAGDTQFIPAEARPQPATSGQEVAAMPLIARFPRPAGQPLLPRMKIAAGAPGAPLVVRGWLVDATGRVGRAGGEVTLEAGGAKVSATTGPDGAFRLELAAAPGGGAAVLSLAWTRPLAAIQLPVSSGLAVLEPAPVSGDQVARDAPAGVVTGVLYDAHDGSPLAATEVEMGVPGATPTRRTTDDAGRFTFTNVPPGGAVVIQAAPGAGQGWRRTVEMSKAGSPGVDLGLIAADAGPGESDATPQPWTLSGRVVDERGQPLAGATVVGAPFALCRAPGFDAQTAVTGADGLYRFSWDGAVAAHLVAGASGRLWTTTGPAFFQQPGPTTLPDLALPSGGSPLVVRVRDAGGGPAAGVEVRAIAYLVQQPVARVVTGADGRAEFPGLFERGLRPAVGDDATGPEADAAAVNAWCLDGRQGDRFLRTRHNVAGNEGTLDLELVDAGRCRVQLKFAAASSPMPARAPELRAFLANLDDPRVAVFDRFRGLSAPCAVQPDGSALIGPLEPGRWRVTLVGPEWVAATDLQTSVAPGETADAGQALLQRAGTVTGVVTDGAGAPLPGAAVYVPGPGAGETLPSPEHGWVTRADARGRFRLTGLPVNPVLTAATLPAVRFVSRQVQLPAGGEVEVTLSVPGTE
ncbi:MAG: carboxypeptidase regulatory-like domain-containing protein [Planctomycetes bacterium]|nr:carboxypeptidase regulatory-like domain-containing protein [Planctomycetota bacterium]